MPADKATPGTGGHSSQLIHTDRETQHLWRLAMLDRWPLFTGSLTQYFSLGGGGGGFKWLHIAGGR